MSETHALLGGSRNDALRFALDKADGAAARLHVEPASDTPTNKRSPAPEHRTAAIDSIALSCEMSAWNSIVERYHGVARNALQTVGGRLQEAHARYTGVTRGKRLVVLVGQRQALAIRGQGRADETKVVEAGGMAIDYARTLLFAD